MQIDATKAAAQVSPKISVVMACHNAAPYVEKAMASVCGQTFPALELIVVDDGSTDISPAIVTEMALADGRVRLVRQANQGPYPTRNRGVHDARGEYIAFLDADDWWAPDALEKLYDAFESRSDAVIAYCGWQNVGIEGGRGAPYVPPDYEVDDKVATFLRAAAPWPIHAALIRRDVLDHYGGFDLQLKTCMDYDLWLRIASTHPIVRVPEVLAYYRHHDRGQITSVQWIQARNSWLVKKKFLASHPDCASHIHKKMLVELVDGGLLRRAYDLYWRRDLVSARRVFRQAFVTRAWGFKDLRYIIPALLPERLFLGLVTLVDRNREGAA